MLSSNALCIRSSNSFNLSPSSGVDAGFVMFSISKLPESMNERVEKVGVVGRDVPYSIMLLGKRTNYDFIFDLKF